MLPLKWIHDYCFEKRFLKIVAIMFSLLWGKIWGTLNKQDAPCKRNNLEYLFGLESKLTNKLILILIYHSVDKEAELFEAFAALWRSFFWLIFAAQIWFLVSLHRLFSERGSCSKLLPPVSECLQEIGRISLPKQSWFIYFLLVC